MADSLELAIHAADLRLHKDIELSMERSGKDAHGMFTVVEWRRGDNTLAKKSVLSGGVAPEYTKRTETYYEANGETISTTRNYTLAWDDGVLISEV